MRVQKYVLKEVKEGQIFGGKVLGTKSECPSCKKGKLEFGKETPLEDYDDIGDGVDIWLKCNKCNDRFVGLFE